MISRVALRFRGCLSPRLAGCARLRITPHAQYVQPRFPAEMWVAFYRNAAGRDVVPPVSSL